MFLVFLRHSQAKDRSRTGEDRDRRLTNAGVRAMRASLPRLLPLLPRGQRIQIWSSPYLRARQTAELLENALTKSGRLKKAGEAESVILPCGALAESGYDGVLEQISLCLSEKKTDLLFLVGHDPQLSDLAEFLTGVPIRLRKGSALCAEIHTAAEGESKNPASLCWFVQGPDFSRWKTLVELEKILQNAFRRVETEADRFLENPDDPEAVHDLRVAVRSLRALVSFIEPFQKKKQNREMQSRLRVLAARLSRLREFDVLLEESAQVDIDLFPSVSFCDASAAQPAEDTPLSPPRKLSDELRTMRSEERDQVLADFAHLRGKSRKKRLSGVFRQIEWRSAVESEGLDIEDLRQRLQDGAARFSESYAALDLRDAEMSHDVRKKAKRIRYVSSSLKPLLGPHPEIVERMTEIQDHLGALCDARVNAALLESLIRGGSSFSDLCRWQATNLLAIEHRREEAIVRPWVDAQAESETKTDGKEEADSRNQAK